MDTETEQSEHEQQPKQDESTEERGLNKLLVFNLK